MSYPKLHYKKLSDKAFTPVKGTKRSSGIDVFSPIDVTILPGDDVLIPLDLAFIIPEGWDITVTEKSGVSTKKKIIHGAKLCDEDYRGNITIHCINFGKNVVHIKRGDKITQLVMREVWQGDLGEWEGELPASERGGKGFGSTGDKI